MDRAKLGHGFFPDLGGGSRGQGRVLEVNSPLPGLQSTVYPLPTNTHTYIYPCKKVGILYLKMTFPLNSKCGIHSTERDSLSLVSAWMALFWNSSEDTVSLLTKHTAVRGHTRYALILRQQYKSAPVSYTHLDVYKRQVLYHKGWNRFRHVNIKR